MFSSRKSVTSDKADKKVDRLINEREEMFLLILSKGDDYAQSMVNIIAVASNNEIVLNTGIYYKTLDILWKEEEMIKRVYPTQDEGERNFHKRQYYQITHKGLEALDRKREFREKLVEFGKKMTIDLSTH